MDFQMQMKIIANRIEAKIQSDCLHEDLYNKYTYPNETKGYVILY